MHIKLLAICRCICCSALLSILILVGCSQHVPGSNAPTAAVWVYSMHMCCCLGAPYLLSTIDRLNVHCRSFLRCLYALCA